MIEHNALLLNLDKLHTTPMGVDRIKRNINIDTDVVLWCKNKILKTNSLIYKKGKNWYIEQDNYRITVNSYSYTIITVHKKPLSSF